MKNFKVTYVCFTTNTLNSISVKGEDKETVLRDMNFWVGKASVKPGHPFYNVMIERIDQI